MSRYMFVLAAALVAAPLGTAAMAAPPSPQQKADVTARDSRGRPSEVSIDGQTYKVCSATVKDGCINPSQIGMTRNAAKKGKSAHKK